VRVEMKTRLNSYTNDKVQYPTGPTIVNAQFHSSMIWVTVLWEEDLDLASWGTESPTLALSP